MTEHQRQAQCTEEESRPEDLLGYVPALLNAVDKGLANALAAYDLVPLEFILLQNCRRMGECTATQLVQVMPTDPSRISRVVTRMVKDGYLLRRRLPDDRRVVMLRLTEAGMELTHQAERRVRSYFEALLEGINSEERDAFLATASRIIANYNGFSESLHPEG